MAHRTFRSLFALPLAFLTGALLVLSARPMFGDEPSVLPEAGAPKTPASKAADPGVPAPPREGPAPGGRAIPPKPGPERRPEGKRAANAVLEISALRAGREPYAWRIPHRIAATFVTDAPDALTLEAEARVPGRPELNGEIEWQVQPPAGFDAPEVLPKGPVLRVRLRRPGGNPAGMGGPLSLVLTARVPSSAGALLASAGLQQDLRDRLRQEYVDLVRAEVPLREELVDEETFNRSYGHRFPHVRFTDLNWSRQPGSEERYPFIMIEPRLLELLNRLEKVYGGPVRLTSGYRNPVHQVEVHAGVGESHHQYGRAADLFVVPDSAPLRSGRTVASEGDWLRLAAACVRAGGVWIEPMTDSHVGTDGCHVHVDVRTGGPQSRIVRVSGTVEDPAGKPLPGATVRLAGMPAVTNTGGVFALKHVLVPRPYDLTVDAPDRGAASQTVAVAEGETTVHVRLSAQPLATFSASVEGLKRWKEFATLGVRLRNSGFSAASDVQVDAASPNSAVQVQAVESAGSGLPAPESRGATNAPVPDGAPVPSGVLLQPGSESEWLVRLRGTGGVPDAALRGTPLRLTVRYRTASGQPRTQSLDLLPPSVAPTSPVEPVPARVAVRRAPGGLASDPGGLTLGLLGGGLLGIAHGLLRRLRFAAQAGCPASAPVEGDPAPVRLGGEEQAAG